MDQGKYSSLVDALAEVPDPRQARGQQYGWRLLMTLIVWAMAGGQKTAHGIADWTKLHEEALVKWLGLPYDKLPSEATLRRALRNVDMVEVEDRLADLNTVQEGNSAEADEMRRVGQAIDGKALRGAAHHGRPIWLVSRVVHGSGRVLNQVAVDEKSNEITAVPRLLAGRDLSGVVITMDALLTQRDLTRQILGQGGDYVLIAKENQPRLFTTIALHFDQPPPTRPIRQVQTQHKGHGRVEVRRLEVMEATDGWVDWPGIRQIMRRTTIRRLFTGKTSIEVTYGLTSLDCSEATPAELESLWRGHWTIENQVHYVRDVTLGEDACQARCGSTPQMLAALHNAILGCLRHQGWTRIPDALRYYAARPLEALKLIGALPASSSA